jgi:benzodiazapine receptor
MHKKIQALISLVLFVAMIGVNALANILPINGYNTGQVSAFYPNFFVPAGFTFSIWGLIYMLLAGFVITSVVSVFVNLNSSAQEAIKRASPLFQITCLLNAGWIIAWHYLYLEISLLIMLAFLVMLIKIYLRIQSLKTSFNFFTRLWIYHAFVVYLAWISVATIANFTALFVGLGWQGNPFPAELWAIVLICVALLLAIFFVGKLKEPAFGFVLSWAFFGIYSAQIKASKEVGIIAALSVCLLLAWAITILIKTSKKYQ